MLDLNKRGRDVRCFVHGVEGWVIAALAMSGERAEATELAAEFVAAEPDFRVATFGAWYPLVEPHLTRLLDGMRLGGLPG